MCGHGDERTCQPVQQCDYALYGRYQSDYFPFFTHKSWTFIFWMCIVRYIITILVLFLYSWSLMQIRDSFNLLLNYFYTVDTDSWRTLALLENPLTRELKWQNTICHIISISMHIIFGYQKDELDKIIKAWIYKL